MSDVDTLRQTVLSLSGSVFAVLDGAQFEHLPDTLMSAGLEARCLYLDRGDNHPERLVTAPYVVGPLDEALLTKVLSVLEASGPAGGVFWECRAGADALFRHLRGINVVRIPRSAAGEADEEAVPEASEAGFSDPGSSDAGDEFEDVLFRHADANVLAQVIPHLSPEQNTRLQGPASAIVLATGERWRTGAQIVVHRGPTDQGAYRSGPLAFDHGFMGDLDDQRMSLSRRNILEYLKDTAPDYVEKLGEEEARRLVMNAERSGDGLGLQTEHGHGLWALLLLLTGQSLLHSQELRNHIASSTSSPDEVMEEIVSELADADDETWEGWVP